MDSSSAMLSLAIVRGQETLATFSSRQLHSHAKAILPVIETLLGVHDIELKQVDGYGVCLGPGSFTGLRVAVATAKALCWMNGKPAVGVLSTDILVENLPAYPLVGCAIDARKGEVYFSLHSRQASGGRATPVVEPFVATPEEGVEGLLSSVVEPFYLVGSACASYGTLFDRAGKGRITIGQPGEHILNPVVLGRLCGERFSSGAVLDSISLEPVYVRGPSIDQTHL